MKTAMNIQKKDSGFVLIIALIILAILTIIGITGITASNTDIRIAGNDLYHKQVFYHADGGTQIAMEMIEQSFACTNNLPTTLTIGSSSESENFAEIKVINPNFAQPNTNTNTNDLEITTNEGQFITNIKITGTLVPHTSGQDHIIYEILSVCKDSHKNAIARIKVKYRHIIGQEIPCPYQQDSVSHILEGTQTSGIISWEKAD